MLLKGRVADPSYRKQQTWAGKFIFIFVVCLDSRCTIPDPTTSAQPNYESSILLCSHILAAFRGVDEFRSTDHTKVIREVKAELKLRNAAKNES